MAHHHGHSHNHHPAHGHAPATFGRAFAIGITLNTLFVGAEIIAGLATGSVALLADAGHNVSDILGLLVAWAATLLAARPARGRYSYGLQAAPILAALANAVVLVATVGYLGYESILRLLNPQPVTESIIIAVALLGVVINGFTAWLFMGGKHDINIRGAYLHMAADAAVSLGVAAGGLVMLFTGWWWVDGLLGLAITAVILAGTWGLLKESLAMLMGAAPSKEALQQVGTLLASQPGVTGVHDLHIWPMGPTELALTAHLTMPKGHPGDHFLLHLEEELAHHHNIRHCTLQIETNPNNPCHLKHNPCCTPQASVPKSPLPKSSSSARKPTAKRV